MKDQEIIALYISRSEAAIAATEECYGEYCRSIASHILVNTGDVEECINDAYLRAWNSIPPNHPRCLRTYLGRIVRNHAGHIAEKTRAAKRGGGELPLVLEELQECITLKDSTENMVDEILLKDSLNRFLETLAVDERWILVHRCWYAESMREIADRLGISENNAKVILHRTRKKLKRALRNEGVNI